MISLIVVLLFSIVYVQAACQVGGGGIAIAAPNVLFVTSLKLTGDFDSYTQSNNQGGVAGANQICQTLAAAQTATPYIRANAAGFVALLGTSTQIINDIIQANFLLDVVNSQGDCLGANMGDIFTNRNLNDEIFDETGAAPAANTVVFTGSTPDADSYKSNPGAQTSDPNDYCQDFSSSAGATAVGALNSATNDVPKDWLATETLPTNQNRDCDSPTHAIYCALQTAPASLNGDPILRGLQGQRFQIHGVPDEYFNLISHPEFQMNSHFQYLATGTCHYNTTACWTHPGTYVDVVGFMFPSLQVRIVAGSHVQGFTVYINDVAYNSTEKQHIKYTPQHQHQHDEQTVRVAAQQITIHRINHEHIMIRNHLFTFNIQNSDMFLNFDFVFHDSHLLRAGSKLHTVVYDTKQGQNQNNNNNMVSQSYPAYPMHGLLGITWKNARYQNSEVNMVPGQVDDYMLQDHQLLSTKFTFNQYQHAYL